MIEVIINALESRKYLPYCLEFLAKNPLVGKISVLTCEADTMLEQGRIRYVIIKNRENLAETLNEIIKKSAAEYICLMREDVLLIDGALEKLQTVLADEKTGLVMPTCNAALSDKFINKSVERGEVADVIAQGERVNNVKDAENVPILQADDYCALFKRQLFDEGIAFNEKMQGFSMLAQDFFLQILQKKYLCKLEKNCFVFTAKLKNYDFGKYDMYAFEKKWGESYNELIGFNQRILKAIEKSGAKKILHIGCLLGSIFFELAERDGAMKFYGISQNAVYMNIAANVAEKVYDDFAKFDLLLSEGEFDYIILESIPESCPDVKDLLKALRRSLKNSGEMIAVIPNAQFAGYIKKLVLDELPKSNLKEYDTWAERYFTKKQFSCLASEAGFSIMDIYGVAGQEEVDFIKSLQNVEHNETADIFFRLCRLIYVLYPERREIAFSLRKLEYDLDCEKSASFLAGDIKNGALSFRQLLFYLERYTVHKERCLYNLLAEWNKNAEYDLISRFGDAFLAYDALPNDLLVKTLERIVR